MKKIIFSLALTVPLVSLAIPSSNFKTDDITYVSRAEMQEPTELRVLIDGRIKEMSEKGFIEQYNPYAQYLLNLKKTSINEIRAYRNLQDKEDTHLKGKSEELKLAFDYKDLPVNHDAIIGYAPIGSYVQKPREGWNGIKVFFETKELGVCGYEFTDLKLSNGGVMIDKENVKFLINKKPTILSAEGDKASGFVSSVIWYNKLQVNRLDCAKVQFQKDLIELMISFANDIDKR